MKACAFSGHRPEKMGFGGDEGHPDCMQIKKKLYNEIIHQIEDGTTVFITGMARGVDIWAAEIVLKLKETQPHLGIQLWAAIPYDRQAAAWPPDYQRLYRDILSQADRVDYVSHAYTRGCLFARNRFMVDRATHLIAVYNGSGGGTGYTVDYAQSKGIPVSIIEP